jgi:hypothetical protein
MGQGVDKDLEEAVRYYRMAASQSHPSALYNFGRCLEYGKGIGHDFDRAAKYYRLGAELGNSAAQNSFGMFLERGIGVQQNLALAAQYYRRASDMHFPDFMQSADNRNLAARELPSQPSRPKTVNLPSVILVREIRVVVKLELELHTGENGRNCPVIAHRESERASISNALNI